MAFTLITVNAANAIANNLLTLEYPFNEKVRDSDLKQYLLCNFPFSKFQSITRIPQYHQKQKSKLLRTMCIK